MSKQEFPLISQHINDIKQARAVQSEKSTQESEALFKRYEPRAADYDALNIPFIKRPLVNVAKILKEISTSSVILAIPPVDSNYPDLRSEKPAMELSLIWNIHGVYNLAWNEVTVGAKRDEAGSLIGLVYNGKFESDLISEKMAEAIDQAVLSPIKKTGPSGIVNGQRPYLSNGMWDKEIIFTSGYLPQGHLSGGD